MINIFIIIVLYNMNCNDSVPYQSIKKIKDVNLIICDNSTGINNNRNIVEEDGYTYINMCGNKGISKAYNKAIELIPKDKNNYICLFDDDTKMTIEYLDKVSNFIKSSDADVFLPIVKTKERLLSPCKFYKNKIYQVADIKDISLSEISAINSGMVIRSTVMKKIKYNENLFLDYVDHEFIRDVKDRGFKIKIMNDVILYQNFSMEENNYESAYNRLCIMNNDLKEFYKNDYFSYFKQIIAYKLVMIRKYHKLKFMFLKR